MTTCLRQVLLAGAEIAWCGFEGSFDIHYLLHPDIADQLYAVATREKTWLALDDSWRLGDEWRSVLSDLRQRIQ